MFFDILGLVKEAGVSGLLIYLWLFIATYCPGLGLVYLQHQKDFFQLPLPMMIIMPFVYSVPFLIINFILVGWYGFGYIPDSTLSRKEEQEQRVIFHLLAGSLYTFFCVVFLWIIAWFVHPGFRQIVNAAIIIEVLNIISFIWLKATNPNPQLLIYLGYDKNYNYYLEHKTIKEDFDSLLNRTVVGAWFHLKFSPEGLKEFLNIYKEADLPIEKYKKATHQFLYYQFDDKNMRIVYASCYADDVMLDNTSINDEWFPIVPNTLNDTIHQKVMESYNRNKKYGKSMKIHKEINYLFTYITLGCLILYLWKGFDLNLFAICVISFLIFYALYKGTKKLAKLEQTNQTTKTV